MKSLILSFFLVILGYSFFFNEKEETKQVITPPMQKNSVYYDVHPVLEQTDSILILKNKIAFIE
ncbi:MAG: hypothetical protein LBL58_02430 [Tannerellaceae bacterium]|jgi:hypothetical protein|nr:hypothetical protein [Tannerellaceae bacterium]